MKVTRLSRSLSFDEVFCWSKNGIMNIGLDKKISDLVVCHARHD